MGMVFLEMAQPKLYADSRFLSLPRLLLCQFKKTFTPLNRNFRGKSTKIVEKYTFIHFKVPNEPLLIAT